MTWLTPKISALAGVFGILVKAQLASLSKLLETQVLCLNFDGFG